MSRKPRILNRQIVARTGVFRIERIDLEFANGSHRRYERLLGDSAGSVLIVPILDPETVVLIREYAAGSDRYELGLPKGLVEAGENILEAANREIREEIGYAARDLRLLQTLTLAPGYIQHSTHIVLARDLRAETAVGDEPEPPEVIHWPLAGMDRLLSREDFTEARSLAALFLAQRFLRSEPGKTTIDADRIL